MKRSIIKRIITVILLVSLCLCNVSAILAFAVEAVAENDTDTEYGAIPEEYLSKTFVAFSGGKCIGASDAFNGTAGDSGTAIISIAHKVSRNGAEVQILMLKDYTSPSEYFDNLGQCTGRITLDLNGHTFNANGSPFRLQTKTNTLTTPITIKNGNMVLGNSALMRFGTYTMSGKSFSVLCENVNFSLKPGSTLTSMIASYSKSADLEAIFGLEFKNCVFDVRNATKHINIFEANDPVNKYPTPLTFNYSVKDCVIKASSPDSFTVWGTFN